MLLCNQLSSRPRQQQQMGCQMAVTPSVNLALPPVGVHNTAEQLLQTTTLCEWLNTVVLHTQRWTRQ